VATCFVIQPFDGGRFDKRYEDVFAPAIKGADLEPYRVDRDPQVSVPIDDIETGIQNAEACLVDITTDNPNVWFELGYAMATRKEVALVCSHERTQNFPFDVQHRSIIRYKTESSSDFDQLRVQITDRLRAILQRKRNLGEIGKIHSISRTEGLEQYEVAILVAVAEEGGDPDGGLSASYIRQAMQSAGFTKLATTLGLRALVQKGMLDTATEQDQFDGDTFTVFQLTHNGFTWLLSNKERFALKLTGPTAG
jgi:hypothetical protein